MLTVMLATVAIAEYAQHEGHCAPDPALYGCRYPQEFGGNYNGDGTCARNQFCEEYRGQNAAACRVICDNMGAACVAFEEAFGGGLKCRTYHADGNVSRGSAESVNGREPWCRTCPHNCGAQAGRADCWIRLPDGPTNPPTTGAPSTPVPTGAPAPTMPPADYARYEGHCAPGPAYVEANGCRTVANPSQWNGAGQCNEATFCQEFRDRDAAFCEDQCNQAGAACVAYEEALGGGLSCRLYSEGGHYAEGSFPNWCTECEHNCNSHAGRGDCWIKNMTTTAPTASPTAMPTRHACANGSHDCDATDSGICEQVGTTAGWRCSCVNTHHCSDGDCRTPGHTCVLTTAAPTGTPTPAPTRGPTTIPTYLPTISTPTVAPTDYPTSATPTGAPTYFPTYNPVGTPTTTTAIGGLGGPDSGASRGGAQPDDPEASSGTVEIIVVIIMLVLVVAVIVGAAFYIKKFRNGVPRGGAPSGFENPMYAASPLEQQQDASGYMDVPATSGGQQDANGYMDVPGGSGAGTIAGYMDVSPHGGGDGDNGEEDV